MGAEAAARLGDEIAHGPGMAAMLVGAVVGAMVGAAIVTAAAIAAPVTAAIVVGASVAAGALSMKQLVRGFCSVFKLPEPPSGSLMNGSGDVFINGKPAVRAGIDVATPCTGVPLNHPALPVPVLVAEGSANVFINGRPVARLKDKLVCGAHISGGSDNVFIGGGTQGTGHSVINIEEWTETAFEWLGLAALVGAGALAASAGVGALAIFGATALGINEALIGLGKLGDRLGPGYSDLLQGAAGIGLLLTGQRVADQGVAKEFPCSLAGEGLTPIKEVDKTIIYRVDGRPPETIFAAGFQPRGTSTDLETYVNTNSPSAFVSTSKTRAIADNPAFAKPGTYLYEVDGAQINGIDVNRAYPDNPFAHEAEIAVIGGIPSEAIISAKPILSGGGLGPTIPNPTYNGGL